MCGIAGFLSRNGHSNSLPVLKRMTEKIDHRGPDGEGFFIDSFAALGHKRLSIIDINAGHQPMYNEDGNSVIVYNGEIYNHASIRPALEHAGHRYASHCDTETILHASEEWGDRSLDRYRGMFAFAIWDRRKQELFCARDRLGIKPFYYFFDGDVFVFASEIKALLEHPAISARFNETLLPEYLTFGFTSGEDTLFKGIRKLMPGHLLRISMDRFEPDIRQFWAVPRFQEQHRELDEQTLVCEARRRLEETIELRLMSDVPLGMFLSGGLDSSAIAAVMRRISSGPVKTFSVGYEEAQFSELSYARIVAERIGTEHHEVVVGMDDFFTALPSLIWHEDEPIAWPSSVSLFFVSRLASEQVKVVLTGEGSDELFAGYGRYRYQLWNQRWAERWNLAPAAFQTMVRKAIESSCLLTSNLRRKLNHTFLGRTNALPSLYLDNFYGAFSELSQRTLLDNPALAATHSPYTNYMRHWREGENLPYLERMLYADKKTYLIELLMKQDQMSMAASIESRVPFLDHQYAECASQVPGRLKLRGGEGKYILKKAVEDLLPHDIVYRKKMGFPTPLKKWLLQPSAESVYRELNAPDSLISEYLSRPNVAALIDRHRSGIEDATDRIWNLLNLQKWGNIFLRGQPVPRAGELEAVARS
jgi:asparagine synthase (glutamine-hydrolysing)